MSLDAEPAAPERGSLPVTASSSRPPASRRSKWLRSGVRIALGLVLGLGVAEAAFWYRDGGAFPHLNVYVEDGERGVRLRPGATERIRFSKNPITKVRINSEGYRGAEWPAPAADEIIVVGDSQVLGLGVEENETFSASLQSALGQGVVVRNLGVPTYGPPEYNAVVQEALAKRPAKTVVYVVNMANDLFESTRPNKDRHVVWDGWAVRKETAPSSVTRFPGRGLLYTESHAFFALRGYVHAQEERGNEQGFASEGTWRDIGDAASSAQKERAIADAESARLAKIRSAQLKYAAADADEAARKLDSHLIYEGRKDLVDGSNFDYDNPSSIQKEALLVAGRLNPGDIVTTQNGETSRDVRVNAEHIRRGALLRLAIEKRAREKAQAARDKEALGLFEKRDELEKKVADLRAAPIEKLVALSPLAPALKEVKATCDRHGARLVIVALPIDVQVSKSEWAKYGVEPVDMEPTKILNEDIVVAARVIGAEGFDALSTLADAQPGAFLDGDLHMTPKGHRALGEALAKFLRAPKLAMPGDGLPALRSSPPKPEEWLPNTEIAVRESDPAGCETKRVREWLGIFCRQKGGAKGVSIASGSEVSAGALPGQSLLIAPMIPGQDVKATFAYDGSTRDFIAKVGESAAAPDIGFTKPLPARADIPGPPPEAAAFCTCWTAQSPGKTCASATTPASDECARTYGTDCAKLLACAAGDPAASPKCAPGEANAGAARRCHALCSNELPCKTGRCTSWQGGQVCM